MEQARDSGAVRTRYDCLRPDDGSSQQQSDLADADGSGRIRGLRRGCGDRNSARPCHLHSILRHVSARGAEFDAERRGSGEPSRTGGHRRADPTARSGTRTRCAGHAGAGRNDSRKVHGSESRLKDPLLKSEELTQRTQRITESHREIDPALSAVYISSYPASPPRSLWLFSVASVPSVLKSCPFCLRAAECANLYRCAAAFACSGWSNGTATKCSARNQI